MTLAFGAPQGMVGAFEAMGKLEDVELAQVKNKFANPTPLGYRDMNTCVRVNLGADDSAKKHIAEVQLNLSEMLKAKEDAHVHYEKIRSVIGAACKGLSDDVADKLQEFIVSKLSSSVLDAAVAELVESRRFDGVREAASRPAEARERDERRVDFGSLDAAARSR